MSDERDRTIEKGRKAREKAPHLRPVRQGAPRPEDPEERAWRGHGDDDDDEGCAPELESPPRNA